MFRLPYLMGQEEKVPAVPGSQERDEYMGEQHPWWKVAVPPSNPTTDETLMDSPESGLKLGWVFGNSTSWLRQVREVFSVHVGGTRCVPSSTDNNLNILARITVTVECIRTCIFLCLFDVSIQ
jgi:hypothetical protein